MNDLRITKIENKQGNSPVKFCWECGRKLYGNHYALCKFDDGYARVLHKRCAQKLQQQQKQPDGPLGVKEYIEGP